MKLGLRKSNVRSHKERFALMLVEFVTIAEALVFILSFGLVCVHWRAELLFSEWYDQFCE